MDLPSLAVGETGNYPHEECGSGNKKPLRITRKANGYVWFCYRCSGSGFASAASPDFKLSETSGVGVKRNAAGNPIDSLSDEFLVPSAASPVYLAREGNPARVFAERYCSLTELNRHGVRILRNTLYVPLSQGYTYRVFDEDWQGPKWVHKVSPVSLDRYLFVRNVCDECLVLVEDCFSAFCVGRHTSALCLLGTHASEHMLAWIQRRGYPRIRIFLDDDNADVKKSQTRLKAKLELFCDDVQIIHSSGRDPKEHSDAELKEILCGIHDPSI